MVLGEESFYTIDGAEVNRGTLVQRMIDYYNSKYPDTQITDFNEGSEIRNLLESIAVDIYHMELDNQNILRACFLATSYGTYLDLFGEEYHTPRDLGEQSRGVLTFSIPEATTTEILIPRGTSIFDSDTGILFDTTGDTIINIGDTTATCSAISRVIGENTNAKPGKLTVFADQNNKPYSSLSVTNINAFTGGRDYETDDEYRSRLLQVKGQDSFGSREYYIRLGESIDGVHDVLLHDKTGYTAEVLVNGDIKPLDDDILAMVTGMYTTEANLVYNHNFTVSEVDYTTVDLELTVGVSDEVDDQLFIDLLTTVFDGGYIEAGRTSDSIQLSYPGVRIGEYLTNYQLLTALESLSFVIQVTSLTSDGETFTRLEPDTDTVLQLGEVTVTQEVVE